MVKPGTYLAHVKEYGVIPPKAEGKAPKVTITFEVGGGDTITYFGAMSPEGAEYTMKNLLRCGFKSDDLSALASEGAFDGREVEIVVANEEYNGKSYTKVKWINEAGGQKFKTLAKNEVSAQLGSFNAYMKGLRAEQGQPKEDDFKL